MLLRHNIDRLGRASSASNKSGSCASILTLHTLVGAAICGARTEAAAHSSSASRSVAHASAAHPDGHDLCAA